MKIVIVGAWPTSRSRPSWASPIPAAFISPGGRSPLVRENRSDDAAQWLLTLFLGPVAAVLAGILIGLLLRGSGLR
jgi:hypothetical protein